MRAKYCGKFVSQDQESGEERFIPRLIDDLN